MLLTLLVLGAALQQPVPPAGAPPLAGAPSMPPQPHATMVVEPVAMALAAWDRDGDGRTTRAEMAAGVAASFAAIEHRPATPLGYIGYSDWAERWLGDRNALPSPFEVDGDGDDKISLAELQAAIGRTFDRLDRNRDGVLTRVELLTIRASVSDRDPNDRRGKRTDGAGGPRPKR